MSKVYSEYLQEHITNVRVALDWLMSNLPDLFNSQMRFEISELVSCHDLSKYQMDEYDAYDKYFYTKDKESLSSDEKIRIENDFNKAWLIHIHRNPHHWQHWVLINDNPEEGIKALDMPYEYIIEMICDWMSFSIKAGNIKEILSWYKEHSKYMILSDTTRNRVEKIMALIKEALDAEDRIVWR